MSQRKHRANLSKREQIKSNLLLLQNNNEAFARLVIKFDLMATDNETGDTIDTPEIL